MPECGVVSAIAPSSERTRIGISCARAFSVNRGVTGRGTVGLRSGPGRVDPRKRPQTCVRGRVSVGEGFPSPPPPHPSVIRILSTKRLLREILYTRLH